MLPLVMCCVSATLAQQVRYTAGLNDGSTLRGDKLVGWHVSDGQVRLEGKVICDRAKPLRWLRNGKLKPWRADGFVGGYIEFVGGDRLIGTLIGSKNAAWDNGVLVPMHLMVRPASTKRLYSHGTDEEIIRVLPRHIRRVVFNSDLRHKFQPGSVYLRDRRRVSFIRMRWGDDSVHLLLKEGAKTVRLGDISEIHMPRIDPWRAYYRQLAVLSPDCRTPLVRIETTEGLVATGSRNRLGARAFYDPRILRQAIERRRHYNREIARLEEHEARERQRLEAQRKKYQKQVDQLEAAIKKDAEAHKKAMALLGGGLDKQLKADAAECERQKKELRDKFDRDLKEIDERVARLPESRRASQRKHYVASKKRSLDRSLKSLDTKLKSSADRSRREFDRALQQWELKKKSIASARERLNGERERFEQSARGRSHHRERLELARELAKALPGPDGNADSWRHMVQPAWSLDPLWVPFNTIVMRSVFSPRAVPLSRMRPTDTAGPVLLRWRVDRNTDGGLLCSGSIPAGSGFGVHAFSELRFNIPPEAVSFQSRIGLDSIVDNGGCVRARVYLGAADAKPIYESPLIVGSAKSLRTGSVSLPASDKQPRSLVLQVDPVVRDHPPKADPLNIRDKFDWLDPQVSLDPNRLREQVWRHAPGDVGAWRDWTAELDKNGAYQWGSWFDKAARFERGLFLPAISAKGKPLRLVREMKIPADGKWLVVDADVVGPGKIATSAIRLHIDGKEIPAAKTPVDQYWRRRRAGLVYSLQAHRGKEVKLELTQAADGKMLYWRAIRTSSKLPGAYLLKRSLEESGKGDMQVTRGLGLTLESGRIKKAYVLEALEVMRLGGRVTFCNEVTGQFRYEYLYGVMVGRDWKGGDKTFDKLKDLRWVRFVLLAKDSGVSAAAGQRLAQAKGENFVIRTVERTPSAWGGMSCDLTVRNRTKNELKISRIHGWGGLSESFQLKAGAEVTMHAHEGQRFEAHVSPGSGKKGKPASRTWVNGDMVWEIK